MSEGKDQFTDSFARALFNLSVTLRENRPVLVRTQTLYEKVRKAAWEKLDELDEAGRITEDILVYDDESKERAHEEHSKILLEVHGAVNDVCADYANEMTPEELSIFWNSDVQEYIEELIMIPDGVKQIEWEYNQDREKISPTLMRWAEKFQWSSKRLEREHAERLFILSSFERCQEMHREHKEGK